MSQCGNGLRQIPARRFIEVKQHWQVVALAKFLSNGIGDSFAFLCETAQDEHHFRCDGVDHVPDLFVVQKQVDELRDFKIINGDRVLVARCNKEILLLCV